MKEHMEQRNHELRSEAESGMRAFFEQPAGLHLICGLDGTIEQVNASWQDDLGYAQQELLRRNIQELIHPDDLEATRAEMEKLGAGETVSRFKNRYRHKDGSWRKLMWWASVPEDENKIYAIAHDLTETEQSEERLKLALQGADLGTWDWHIPSGHVVFNERWAQMLGYQIAEIEPNIESWKKLTHPEDLAAASRQLEMHFENKTDLYECALRMRHKDGGWIWILDRGRVIERDEKGAPVRACGTHLDITDRKTAEIEAQIARDRLEYINLILNTIRDVNQLITQQRGYEDFLQPICETIVSGQGLYNAWIALLDPESGDVTESYAAGEDIDFTPMVDFLKSKGLPFCARQALGCDTPVIITNPTPQCPDCPLAYQHDDRARIVQRLECDDRVYGVLSLAAPARFAHDQEELGLIREMAHDVAFAMNKAETKRKLDLTEFALENASDTVFWIGPDGRFLFVNKEACRQLGYTREELLSMSIADIDPDFPAERWPQHWKEMKATGAMRFETHHQTKDGRVFPVEVYGSFIEREGQEYIFAFVHDITARQQQRQTIEQSNRDLEAARLAALNMMEDALQDKERLEKSSRAQLAVIKVLHTPTDTLQEFLDEALNEAIRLTDSKIGYIYFYDEEKKQFILNSWSKDVMKECSVVDPQTCYELDKTGIWGEAVRQRKPILLNNFKADHPHKKGLPKGHVELSSFLTVPIFEKEQIVAVVGVANKACDYEEQDILTLQIFMDSVWASTKEIKSRQALKESTEQLQQSETRFKTLHNASFGGIIIHDKGLILDCNQGLSEITGYSQQELIGMDGLLLIAEPSRQWVMDHILAGNEKPYEAVGVRKNGQEYPLRLEGRQIPYQDKEVRVVEFRDVTDQKRVEQQLQAEKDRSEKLVACAPNIIVGLRERSEIVTFNRYAEKLTGWTAEEVIGKEWIATFIPEEQREDLYRVWDEIIENELIDHRFENEIILRSGERRLIEWHNTIISEGDRFQMILSLGVDITERKKNEAELQRLSIAIEQTPETVVITDKKGTIQYVNPAFTKTTGYTREEALGKNPRILKSGQHDAAFYSNLWKTITAGKIWEGRIINKRKNGAHYTEEVLISPVRDSAGTTSNFVAVKRDITDDLVKEEKFRQSQKMEAIGQLAGGVAHDFNNILQAILGFSDVLAEKLADESQEQLYVKEIRKSAQRAAELTRQLLAFSRKQPIEKAEVDLNATIQDTEVLLTILLGNEIHYVFDPDPELKRVYIDHGQITQIIMNLAVNARDAMSDGGRLSITTRNVTFDSHSVATMPDAEPGCFVCLSVTDTGIGMSREVQEHLFEPFFTTKDVGRGTGLGLAVIYGIVKQNKGWIHVYSEENQGTSFNIYLPTGESSAQNKSTHPEHHERILLEI